MSNIVSTWSPSDLVLPSVTSDIDYAFYFVTEKGSYKGLNLSFEKGDWLVYLKKNGVGNWYKSNGIVAFNTSNSANAPDPGYYTKVRLDNNGNIIAGDYIEESDLPAHTHVLSDITDTDNLKSLIQTVVGEMITNHDDSSVKLNYDTNTKTISAEVNYDGITIDQNEFGELEAIGGNSGSSSSASGTVTISQVEDLTAKLNTLESAVTSNTIITNTDSGLNSEKLEGGTVLSVNVDGSSIRVNAYGQLEVNPDFIVTEDGEVSSSASCANHNHTASQIEDLEEYVLNLINNNKSIDVSTLPIDGTTIVINNNGTLSAVAAATAAHSHVMSDITDLNKAKADTWASDQPLQGDAKVDYTQGSIDLSNFTIGYSIEKISEALKEITTRVEYTESMVGKVVPSEPLKADSATLSVEYKNEKSVLNIKTKKTVTAGSSAIITSSPIYPSSEGSIVAYVDGDIVGSISLSNGPEVGVTENGLTIESIQESYPDAASFQGFYKSAIISYELSDNLTEGEHTICFVHNLTDGSYSTPSVIANIYKEISPIINITGNTLSPNKYVSGVHVYQGDGKISGSFTISKAYNSLYMPLDNVKFTMSDKVSTLLVTINDDGTATGDFDITITEDNIETNFPIQVYNFAGDVAALATVHSSKLLFDTTTVDESKYRYIPSREDDSENPIYTDPLVAYNPENAVPEIELVINNDIASVNKINYAKWGLGPDYSDQTLDYGYSWINFVFKSDFRNNIYMDILDKDSIAYSKNKNGTLKDIKIYVGQSSTLVPEVWVNGNTPYDGCSTASGINYAGLDLFRSDNSRRYVTFGQRPIISSGYIFVRIGITENKTLDCKALVNSILESINE